MQLICIKAVSHYTTYQTQQHCLQFSWAVVFCAKISNRCSLKILYIVQILYKPNCFKVEVVISHMLFDWYGGRTGCIQICLVASQSWYGFAGLHIVSYEDRLLRSSSLTDSNALINNRRKYTENNIFRKLA